MHVCISAPTVPQDGVERPVNRALFCQSYAGIFNVQSPAKYKLYAYSLFSYFSSKEVMGTSGLLMEPGGGWWRWWVGGPVVWPNMPVQGTGTALLEQHTLKALHFSFLFGPADVFPLRRSDWSLDKVAKWEARGYARSDVEAYLTTYGEAIPSLLRCTGAAPRCCRAIALAHHPCQWPPAADADVGQGPPVLLLLLPAAVVAELTNGNFGLRIPSTSAIRCVHAMPGHTP